MDILKSKHRPAVREAVHSRSLGRVGVFILVGFIGLLAATTYVSTQAVADNPNILINQSDATLSASFNHDELDESETINWSWFGLATNKSDSFNNNLYFATICQQAAEGADIVEADNTDLIEMSGIGSSLNLTAADDYQYLYCFSASVLLEGQSERLNYYGGFIPSEEVES